MLLPAVRKLANRVTRVPQRRRDARHHPRVATCRPRLELLEERLPPGDMVLGALLGASWSGPSHSVLDADALSSGTALLGELSPNRQTSHPGPGAFPEADDVASGLRFSLAPLRVPGEKSELLAGNAWTSSRVFAGQNTGDSLGSAASTPFAVNDPFASAFAVDLVQRWGTFAGAEAAKLAGQLASPGGSEGVAPGGCGSMSAVAAGGNSASGPAWASPAPGAQGASSIFNAGPTSFSHPHYTQ
jgi:hypothetical protein